MLFRFSETRSRRRLLDGLFSHLRVLSSTPPSSSMLQTKYLSKYAITRSRCNRSQFPLLAPKRGPAGALALEPPALAILLLHDQPPLPIKKLSFCPRSRLWNRPHCSSFDSPLSMLAAIYPSKPGTLSNSEGTSSVQTNGEPHRLGHSKPSFGQRTANGTGTGTPPGAALSHKRRGCRAFNSHSRQQRHDDRLCRALEQVIWRHPEHLDGPGLLIVRSIRHKKWPN